MGKIKNMCVKNTKNNKYDILLTTKNIIILVLINNKYYSIFV